MEQKQAQFDPYSSLPRVTDLQTGIDNLLTERSLILIISFTFTLFM